MDVEEGRHGPPCGHRRAARRTARATGVRRSASGVHQGLPVENPVEAKLARTEDAPMEISWVPSGSAGKAADHEEGKAKAKAPRRKGVESFGAGLERGVEETSNADDAERQGRTQRRKGIRSGSKNVFRQMDR